MQLAIRATPLGRHAVVHVGPLPIDAVDIDETAQAFIDYCRSAQRHAAERPLYSTSVNGHVISLCARDRRLTEMIQVADSINADGQPLVFLSRYLCANPLPERVATTDLFPVVAALAAQTGVTFYMLGGGEEVNRRAVEATLAAYPSLRIVGRRNGYFSRAEEAALVAQIARLKPDVLWLSLGVPLEQQFCRRNLSALRGVGHRQDLGRAVRLSFVGQAARPRLDAKERSRMAVPIGARAPAPVPALSGHQPSRAVRDGHESEMSAPVGDEPPQGSPAAAI